MILFYLFMRVVEYNNKIERVLNTLILESHLITGELE